MRLRVHSPLFFLLFFTLQVWQCLSACSKGTYIDPSNAGQCLPQTVIKAHLRPTPQYFLYTLTFEDGKLPFSDIDDFTANTVASFYLEKDSTQKYEATFEAHALKSDLSIIQLYVFPVATEIPYGAKLSVSIADYSSDETKPSYISGPSSADIGQFEVLTEDQIDLLKLFQTIDYVLEFVWIIAGIFSPYWLLYSDCKFYRETLDMFKRINVEYGLTNTIFFKANDRRVSGLKVPNIFGIFLLGNDFASEWRKNPENVINFKAVDDDRIDDLKIVVDPTEHQYDSFPLFLDTFGVNLTVILLLLILAGICELAIKLGKLQRDRNRITLALYLSKHFLWNLLFLTVLGAYQSLCFYTVIQVHAFFSEKTTNNLISFGVGVATFLIITTCLCLYLYFAVRRRSKVGQMIRIPDSEDRIIVVSGRQDLKFFRTVLSFYKSNRFYEPLMILLIMPKAIIFALEILLLDGSPIAQTSVMLAITIIFMIAFIVFRPFERKIYTIFKMIYEFIMLVYLGILLFLSINDDSHSYSNDQRKVLGMILIALWFAIPILTVIFAVVELFEYFKQYQAQSSPVKVKPSKVVPTNSIAIDLVEEKKVTEVEEKKPEQKEAPVIVPPPAKPKPYNKWLKPQQQEKPKVNQNETSASLLAESNANIKPSQEIITPFTPVQQNASPQATERPLVQQKKGWFSRGPAVQPQQQFQPQQFVGENAINTVGNHQNRASIRKFPFQPIELKLTNQSQKVIDEKGFKDYVASFVPEDQY